MHLAQPANVSHKRSSSVFCVSSYQSVSSLSCFFYFYYSYDIVPLREKAEELETWREKAERLEKEVKELEWKLTSLGKDYQHVLTVEADQRKAAKLLEEEVKELKQSLTLLKATNKDLRWENKHKKDLHEQCIQHQDSQAVDYGDCIDDRRQLEKKEIMWEKKEIIVVTFLCTIFFIYCMCCMCFSRAQDSTALVKK